MVVDLYQIIPIQTTVFSPLQVCHLLIWMDAWSDDITVITFQLIQSLCTEDPQRLL